MGKRRAGQSTGPRSIAGQWIVAAVLGQEEQHARLVGQLRGPLRGDELAVLRESARLALRSHFGDGYDVRSVTAFAVGVQESWGLPSGAGVMELEAAMRAALGEPDVDLSGIKVATLMEAYFFSVMRSGTSVRSGTLLPGRRLPLSSRAGSRSAQTSDR